MRSRVRYMRILVLVLIAIIQRNVFADNSIYIMDNMNFGCSADLGEIQIEPISDIRSSVFESDFLHQYALYDSVIYEITEEGKVEYKPSAFDVISFKYFPFDELSDLKWFEDYLFKNKNIHEKINFVMYKINKYEYEKYRRKNMKEAWLFTDDNIYIVDLKFASDPSLNDSVFEEVKGIYTYDEWKDNDIYRNDGKCFFNDKLICDGIYFNKHMGTMPLRAVIENIGGTVEWNDDLKETKISYNGKSYLFKYFSNHGLQMYDENGSSIVLGVMATRGFYYMKDDTTYLPEREAKIVLKNLNVNYKFDTDNKILLLSNTGG